MLKLPKSAIIALYLYKHNNKVIQKTKTMQNLTTQSTLKRNFKNELFLPKQNSRTHYQAELDVIINGSVYEFVFSKWSNYRGVECQGWHCQLDSRTRLADKKFEILVEEVKNYKPVNNDGAKDWYGQGRYMGD